MNISKTKRLEIRRMYRRNFYNYYEDLRADLSNDAYNTYEISLCHLSLNRLRQN